MRRDAPELYRRTNTSVARALSAGASASAASVDDSMPWGALRRRYAKRFELFRRDGHGRESSRSPYRGGTDDHEHRSRRDDASPTTVEAHGAAVEAARLMAARERRLAARRSTEEDLVGMVTDRDLVFNVLAKDVDPHKVTVASICSENPIVVGSGGLARRRAPAHGDESRSAACPWSRSGRSSGSWPRRTCRARSSPQRPAAWSRRSPRRTEGRGSR